MLSWVYRYLLYQTVMIIYRSFRHVESRRLVSAYCNSIPADNGNNAEYFASEALVQTLSIIESQLKVQ